MDLKKEQFLARLREIFQGEAAEHIAAIAAGLVAVERASDVERVPIVERIFREAHSLKGAARSVSLPGVEAFCMELESIFAAMKREELALSTTLLDVIHPALDVLAVLCAKPGETSSPEAQGKENQTLQSLRRIVRITPAKKPESPAETSVPQFRVASEAATPAATLETVRVSTQKLGAILREAEELVGARITASGHATEIRDLAASVSHWNQGRVRLAARQRRIQKGAPTGSELIESELLYTRALENSLRTLARSAHQDARALGAIADSLLEDMKKVLLLPCSYLLSAFPKLVRDLAREQNKEADLIIHGEDIEIDRRVLDELKDPLIHLLRNAVDHGLEKPEGRQVHGKPSRGVVTFTVTTVPGNRVEITVGDDGVGIESARVRKAAVRLGFVSTDEAVHLTDAEVTGLVFNSGLSTSPIITDLSGRGLGLAIVREKVEKLGGTVSVTSTPGAGTVFRLLVPLSLATFRGVFVAVAGKRFAIPTASVVRVARVKADEIKTVESRQTIALGGVAVSLVCLRDILALSGPDGRSNGAARPVVVIRAADRQVAFLVDDVLGEQEVMVKSLGRQLAQVRNVAAAAITGSGAVIPILDALDLVESATTAGVPGPVGSVNGSAEKRKGRLLIAEDSITARTLVKTILEGAGYEVVATVDGMDALTRLKTEPFDLLVSDVDMPRLNGFELTARIRADKKLSELPVLLVTALGSQKDREYGIEVGANAYIVKSDFDQSNLIEIIRRLL